VFEAGQYVIAFDRAALLLLERWGQREAVREVDNMPMSVRLDARTERLVNRLAKTRSQTKSEVIRDAIMELARRETGRKDGKRPYDAIAHLIGCVDSGGAKLSEKTGKKFVSAFRSLRDSLATVWPAFTEAMYLLGFSWEAQDALWEMIETQTLLLLPLDQNDVPRMKELMRKYRDLPMGLADAALVRVAEREKLRRIFTLDRRDFEVYRPARMGRFSIIP